MPSSTPFNSIMPTTKSPIPKLDRQPVTVDFIDNHLPKHHPAFVDPPARFDPMCRQYVPTSQAVIPISGPGAVMVSDASANLPDDIELNNELIPRPAVEDTKAMKFWNGIFPEAMDKFRSTAPPKGRAEDCNIRGKDDWDAIYDTLEAARTQYQDNGGRLGSLRMVRRKLADNITPVTEATKFASKVVPNDPYATPVLSAVGVLLDAVKTAAGVRKQALKDLGLDGLIPIFSDVELFLGTFPNDVNIRHASVELTVATLDAIERTIGFFLKNSFKKATSALFMGDDYERDMLQSLQTVKDKSRSLMEEGLKSHIHSFHRYSQETQKMYKEAQKRHEDTQLVIVNASNSLNAMERCLADHVYEKDRQIEAKEKEIRKLQVENAILRSSSVSPFQQMIWAPPPPQPQAPVMEWYISQETLRRVLDTHDLDLADIAFVSDIKTQLPAKQRLRTEQIISTELFRDWIVSPSSTKLLVKWDSHRPKTVAGVSPLSVFCTTMAHALRAKERFVSLLWFCGRHVDADEPGVHVGPVTMLVSLIDQLLRQYAFDMRPLHHEVDLEGVQRRSVDALTKLLGWLVRRLPQTVTIVCVVDGVALFERDEFLNDAFRVFGSLLGLTADQSVAATVKVLFTSTPGPEYLRVAFENEDLILNVDTLPQLPWAPNDERIIRTLEGDLGED